MNSPPISGGSEKQAERLATFMAAQGKSVWAITRRFPGFAAKEERDGFVVIRPATFGLGKFKTLTFVLGSLWHLWKLRKRYAILHAHMLFGAAFSAVLAGRMLNKRSIVKLGSSGVSGEVEVSRRTRRGQLRLALLRRWADKVVVLDEIMQAEAVSIGISPDNIKLISNGIDAQLFSVPTTVNKADIMPAEKVNVLFVGRLVDEKSLPTLLKAFQKSLRTCPYLHLTLVGDGPDRNMLEALVEYLQIKKRTTFAGKQRDVHAYLSHADIFVLPSKTEGMSNALLEAMAAGLPCLATPVGASPRMLDSGNSGILLPVGDVDAWAQALSDMGHDPERRASLGQTAKRRVMSEYDFSIIGARYEALYAELVKLNASAGQRM